MEWGREATQDSPETVLTVSGLKAYLKYAYADSTIQGVGGRVWGGGRRETAQSRELF